MKRITHIKLHNYRAFYKEYQLSLPKGENVLLYGENGSGKSSVYKALKDFFASSENPNLQFWRNTHAKVPIDGPLDGTVEITFNNHPVSDSGIGAIYNFSTIPVIRDAQTETFIKKANKAKAFLSYQELVQSYIVPKDDLRNPDLYELFIEGILGEFVLPSGLTINDRWKQIFKNYSIKDERVVQFNKAVKTDIPAFEKEVLEILKPILLQLNTFLSSYFKNHIVIDISQFIIRAVKQKKRNWIIDKVFRLNTSLFDTTINNGYHNHLNEARLSAIAICLYLAAIKKSPQPDDYRVIFLDDIFIGLDTSNRLPLLELLKAEFSDHQIFISTYDRFWYETAKRWFESHLPDQWKCYEMYVSYRPHLPDKSFDKPILTTVSTNWERGVFYLQHEINPDYPASANSFRKFFEEILNKYFPEFEFRQANNEKIESYKLSKLVSLANDFLLKTGDDNSYLVELKSSLPTLLHPLSHYEISSPLYRGELLRVRDNLELLEQQLKALDLKSTCKNVISKGEIIRFYFIINANQTGYYELVLNEHLCKTNQAGQLNITLCNCHYSETYIINAGNKESKHSFSKKKTIYFKSLQDAYLKTHAHIITQPTSGYSSIQQMPEYLDAFQCSDDGIVWAPLKTLLTL